MQRAKKIGLTALIMVVLFAIAGTVYVFIVDRQAPPAPAKKSAASKDTTSLPKPIQPGANVPEGVAIDSFVTPVKAGENSDIDVRTLPQSVCTISVSYNGVASRDSGLAPKTANAYGFVEWSWTVEPSVPPGSYPVKVTCTVRGKTGVVVGNLVVTS